MKVLVGDAPPQPDPRQFDSGRDAWRRKWRIVSADAKRCAMPDDTQRIIGQLQAEIRQLREARAGAVEE